MNMKILKSVRRLCTCCMEEHDVKTVQINEKATYKNVEIEYVVKCLYCDLADELYMDEQQMQENDICLKNAYRKKEGLLTSDEIVAIREKYDITQTDLCTLLGWGAKTITRYESHQVQDRAHDTILKKIDRDPEWFIFLLNNAKENLSDVAYNKCLVVANRLYEEDRDLYLRKAIEAEYARFKGDKLLHGNKELSLDIVIDVIRYFAASTDVTSLYKVKLMKLLWYADALSYKTRKETITGLVYQAYPMGAVPVGHNSIINLKAVPCEEVDIGETNAYHFFIQKETAFPFISDNDKKILNTVIKKIGRMTKKEIVAFMHNERAYTETAPWDNISFEHTDSLQI